MSFFYFLLKLNYLITLGFKINKIILHGCFVFFHHGFFVNIKLIQSFLYINKCLIFKKNY